MSEQLPPYPRQPEHSAGACGPVPGRPSPSAEGQLPSLDPPPVASGGLSPIPDDLTDLPAGDVEAFELPRLQQPRRGRRLVAKPDAQPAPVSPEQRLLLLDTWKRSGLPAGDFAPLVGVSKHTLYAWKKKFETEGPAGLMDQPRGGLRGSKLPKLTKRTILMLKQANPDWGCQRISDMLVRGPALPASPAAVARVLHEAGYQMEEVSTRPHPDKVRFFERAKPNQLWQTDLFTFVLKRQNRRVYLVAFMDDHSRFIVSYGVHASQSTALTLEVLRAGLANYGSPEEVLNDNGTQYVTWRGKSAFTKELEKRGIKQIVAAPRRPQTLGKIERFWGTLWRECIESAVFIDLGDAQRRIGHFIDHYNFQRPHQGIDGLVPADRFFGAAPEVLKTLKARVAATALALARHGVPKEPFYLTGQVGGQPFSVHAEGEIVASLPEPLSSELWITKNEAKPHHHMKWGGQWPMPAVFAPGGGAATDFYATATHGIVHCDLRTRKISFIGSAREGGLKDGMNTDARLTTSYCTADIVTGRVYWREGTYAAGVLRYVEKLLPYRGKTSGKEYLLPAILDYKDQYQLVKGPGGEELELVVRNGKRASPSFAVRTITTLKEVRIPGKTPRPLIIPGGKEAWLTTKQAWPPSLEVEFANTKRFNLETGKVVATLKLATPFPAMKYIQDGVGSHGGTCLGIDGKIYVCQHTGCGGGPMRLISVDPVDGKLTYLYDSVVAVNWGKRTSPQWDGPADAQSVTATSTLWQFQCPRTGAIINGGWDNMGIRRYLDGFVTSVASGQQGPSIGRPEWQSDKDKPSFAHFNSEPAIAPNGDLYIPDAGAVPQRIFRIYRTDWPKTQPEYGYGEKFMPRAKLEELMLEYAKNYIANYEANSRPQ